MLYLTGMRRAELTGLRSLDVDLADATVKVTGKRNKQRIIPVLKPFTVKMEQYLRLRNEKFPEGNREWFFVGNKGNKLYDKYVYNVVRSYLSMVTTIEKKSPHISKAYICHTYAEPWS